MIYQGELDGLNVDYVSDCSISVLQGYSALKLSAINILHSS